MEDQCGLGWKPEPYFVTHIGQDTSHMLRRGNHISTDKCRARCEGLACRHWSAVANRRRDGAMPTANVELSEDGWSLATCVAFANAASLRTYPDQPSAALHKRRLAQCA